MAKNDLADKAKEADKALTTFLKKNNLKRDKDYSDDKKFGKEFKKLSLAVAKANDALISSTPAAGKKEKAGKAKKESKGGNGGRATKYEYPEGLTAEEKKEFRVKARREAKGAGKAEKASKKETPAKGGKADKTTKKEKPAEKSSKKGDKKKSKKNDD